MEVSFLNASLNRSLTWYRANADGYINLYTFKWIIYQPLITVCEVQFNSLCYHAINSLLSKICYQDTILFETFNMITVNSINVNAQSTHIDFKKTHTNKIFPRKSIIRLLPGLRPCHQNSIMFHPPKTSRLNQMRDSISNTGGHYDLTKSFGFFCSH